MRFFFFSALLALGLQAAAQSSPLRFHVNTLVCKDNHLNTCSIYKQDRKTGKQTMIGRYRFNPAGEVIEEYLKNQPELDSSQSWTLRSWTVDLEKRSATLEVYHEQAGKKNLLHRHVYQYNEKQQMISVTETEFIPPGFVRKQNFQPHHPEFTHSEQWNLVPGGDTSSYTSFYHDDLNEISMMKEKRNGVWTEKEKVIMVLSNGRVVSSETYRNGKLISTYTMSDEERLPYGLREDEQLYGLPVGEPGMDTVAVRRIENYKSSKSEGKNLPYYVVRHYNYMDRTLIDRYQVYSKSSLLMLEDQRDGLLLRFVYGE